MQYDEATLRANMTKCGIPDYMRGGIIRYIVNRIQPGSFLCAVIRGDLYDAVNRADDTNATLLANYVRFFVNYAPGECYGDAEALAEWLSQPV